MNHMNHYLLSRRWLAPAVALAALLAIFALLPRTGFTIGGHTPLWNERPVDISAATTVPAPNWVAIAKAVKPAVVNVSTKRIQEGVELQNPFGDNDPFQQYFKQFFGHVPRHTVHSLGSGFIINSGGYLVTNNHVVDGATDIQVKLSDGREFSAKVVGRDSKTDLALLKIEATGLPTIPLGDSSRLDVGTPVMAIGNPFGLEQTVTTGIVSAMGRVIGEGPYDDFIQTDASINPGNSGGPLINAQGQAIGINTAIVSRTGGSVGIGFAIPINHAKPVVTQLAETGRVTRGWLGVSIQSLTPDLAKGFKLSSPSGALVASVLDGSPAQKAGLKAGDVITEYDGHKVERSGDLPRLVADTPIGREVPVTVLRNGRPLTLTARIARLEEPERVASAQSEGKKPALGLSVETLTPQLAREAGVPDSRGVLVRGVEDSSPAANAGLEPGDVIVEVDHHATADVKDLRQALDTHAKGTPLVMLVHRKDATLFVAVAA
jgi:serine protease Do